MKNKHEYIGDISQLIHVKNYRLEGGKADQVRGTDVKNESGLDFTVIADRCMDIESLRFKGINLSYMNQCGVVSPKYYDNRKTEWLRSFTGGFLTTCGLDNIGSPSGENGVEYGMHGRIGNIPADDYSVIKSVVNNEIEVTIRGEMKQTSLFGESLILKRLIKAYQNTNRLIIEDEIVNTGFKDQEFMILYHFNIGYPFLSPQCQIDIDMKEIAPRNEHSQKYQHQYDKIGEPQMLEEMCYYHKLYDREGYSNAGMFNNNLGIGFIMSFQNHVLDRFIQWKNLVKGQYVTGFEPATNYVDGKAIERNRDTIKVVKAQSSIKYKICLDFFHNKEDYLKKIK